MHFYCHLLTWCLRSICTIAYSIFPGIAGRLLMHPWRSTTALPGLWNSEQGYHSHRQIWSAKGICLCGISGGWSCSGGSQFKRIWITRSSAESEFPGMFNYLLFPCWKPDHLIFILVKQILKCPYLTGITQANKCPRNEAVPSTPLQSIRRLSVQEAVYAILLSFWIRVSRPLFHSFSLFSIFPSEHANNRFVLALQEISQIQKANAALHALLLNVIWPSKGHISILLE